MTTPRVLGVDPSLKATGVALPDGTVRTLTTKEAGYLRNADLARQIVTLAVNERVELVVIEGYSLNAPHRLALIRAGELGGIIRTHLALRSIPFVEVPPAELKKYATGNGAAFKEAMVDAAIVGGAPGDITDDEADAFHLRRWALDNAGLDPDLIDLLSR